MRVSIHQPEFMPWAGFFNKIAVVDRMVIFDHVQFKKNYFENRCRIKINGQPAWLTVPVLMTGRFQQKICEVEIDNTKPWGEKTWKTLHQTYRRAPHWAEVADFLEQTFALREWRLLVDLNLHLISWLCGYLDLGAELVLSSTLGTTSSGSELVLDTCRLAEASAYVSGRHGKDYLDETGFAAAGIELIYQDYKMPPYRQFDGDFVGPLSVLDLIVNTGRDARHHVLGEAL